MLCLAIVLAGSTVPTLQTSADEPLPRRFAELDQIVATFMEQHGVPAMSVAVGVENRLAYERGYGTADLEHSVPATSNTRYRTASIAKPITAAAVLSLVQSGELDLDEQVQAYVTNFPNKRWPLTSRQLLGHLGGVRHYKSSAEASSTEHYFSLNAALETFADDPLIHEPGTKYRYSSFGYNLLGSVAEQAGGKPFMELLQERVFQPAGMRHTLADDSWAIIPHRARGYVRATPSLLTRLPDDHNLMEGQLYRSPLHDTSMKIPGGGLLSTAPDLVRFACAVNQRKLFADDLVGAMWTPQQRKNGEATTYGLGWNIGRKSNRRAVWHSGSQSGTSTLLLLFPDSGVCVAIMSNLQRLSLSKTAVQIADLFEPPDANLDAP